MAGFIDAIAGGGGLILVPSFLLAGLPVNVAIATNKMCNVAASSFSAFTFYRHGKVESKAFFLMVIPVIAGPLLGSRFIGAISRETAKPLVAVTLFLITALVLLRPSLGDKVNRERSLAETLAKASAAKLAIFGLVIGFHDGFFGPGAGIFLIFTLVLIGKLDFVAASGMSKAT